MDKNISNNNLFSGAAANKQKTIQLISHTFRNIAKNLWEDNFSFINDNQEVFTGNVADETTKVLSRMHSLGVIMREGQPKHSFDRKM